MSKYIIVFLLVLFANESMAQQWLGSSDAYNKIYRGDKIKVGYGPLYLDWTFENNWGGNASKWAGYIGFNAFRYNDDLKDYYYGENPYTSKLVFEGSSAGFRWLHRAPSGNDSDGQHILNELMRLNSSGFLGIGTTSPNAQLHLASNQNHELKISRANGLYGFRIFRDASAGRVFFQNTDDSNNWGTRIQIEEGGSAWQNLLLNPSGGNVGIGTTSPIAKLTISGSLAEKGLYVQTNDSWIAYSDGNNYLRGNTILAETSLSHKVGIGTANPDSKLTVKGTIHAEEVKVDLNVPAPDYVFSPNYKLLSLEEIKNYIDQHKHLPEVPSAKEMETNGVNVSEMNMILLRKIEELTLHLIEQNKIIAQLQEERRASPSRRIGTSGKKIEELTLHMIEQQKEIKELKTEISNLKK